jgi:uncharacterized MnhB-related membrane protein
MPQISTEYEGPPSTTGTAHGSTSRSSAAGRSGRGQKQLWAGRLISALVVAMMLLSATLKLTQAPSLVAKIAGGHLLTESSIVAIGILELLCTLVYVVPRTWVLGAVLVTGYLGGAVATHVLTGGSFAIPLLLGVLAWLGIYLRDARLHVLLPIRK